MTKLVSLHFSSTSHLCDQTSLNPKYGMGSEREKERERREKNV